MSRTKRSLTVGLSLALAGCAAGAAGAPDPAPLAQVTRAVHLFDPARQRAIPVQLYGAGASQRKPLALISHGYGGRNSDYSFIADHLAGRGYLVASVQHQLPADPELPQGIPRIVRRPSWEQGVANLLFVRRWLIERGVAVDEPVLLIGHSHGGDTSMLFAELHPRLARAVFSLDNRRQPFPRSRSPRICSIRSSDHEADAGVIPTEDERRSLNVLVVQASSLPHNDMWDGADQNQRAQIIAGLNQCLAL